MLQKKALGRGRVWIPPRLASLPSAPTAGGRPRPWPRPGVWARCSSTAPEGSGWGCLLQKRLEAVGLGFGLGRWGGGSAARSRSGKGRQCQFSAARAAGVYGRFHPGGGRLTHTTVRGALFWGPDCWSPPPLTVSPGWGSSPLTWGGGILVKQSPHPQQLPWDVRGPKGAWLVGFWPGGSRERPELGSSCSFLSLWSPGGQSARRNPSAPGRGLAGLYVQVPGCRPAHSPCLRGGGRLLSYPALPGWASAWPWGSPLGEAAAH